MFDFVPTNLFHKYEKFKSISKNISLGNLRISNLDFCLKRHIPNKIEIRLINSCKFWIWEQYLPTNMKWNSWSYVFWGACIAAWTSRCCVAWGKWRASNAPGRNARGAPVGAFEAGPLRPNNSRRNEWNALPSTSSSLIVFSLYAFCSWAMGHWLMGLRPWPIDGRRTLKLKCSGSGGALGLYLRLDKTRNLESEYHHVRTVLFGRYTKISICFLEDFYRLWESKKGSFRRFVFSGTSIFMFLIFPGFSFSTDIHGYVQVSTIHQKCCHSFDNFLTLFRSTFWHVWVLGGRSRGNLGELRGQSMVVLRRIPGD